MDMAECFDPPCDKIRIPMSVNGKRILGVYDSGSDYTVLDKVIAEQMQLANGAPQTLQNVCRTNIFLKPI